MVDSSKSARVTTTTTALSIDTADHDTAAAAMATDTTAAHAPLPPLSLPADDVDLDGSELAALASFNLPASPVRSPVGSESNMSVWVEETTDGEQRVHVALADASVPPLVGSTAAGASATSLGSGGSASSALTVPSSSTSSFDTSRSTSTHSSEMLDFPLVLCDSKGSGIMDRHGSVKGPSSAIVPFQKLQMDTNLNQTLLPYRAASAPVDSGSSSPGAGSPSVSSTSSPSSASSARAKAKSFAWEAETNAIMSNDFMHALRLSELRPQEPQLSVRLRGSRVELASASEEEDVDFMGPAENIKKLFKLPYSQECVSLAVHRVGSTLVVDGELQDSDLPAGFEDFPQETMTIQQSDEMTQSLLYEKFIYESTMQGRLTAHEENEDLQGNKLTMEKTQLPLQHKTKGSKKSQKKAKKRATQKAAAPALKASDESLKSGGGGTEAGHAIPDSSWMDAAMAGATRTNFSMNNLDQPPTAAPAKSKHQQKKATSSSASYSSPSDHRTASHQPYTQAFQRILKWKFHDLKMVRPYCYTSGQLDLGRLTRVCVCKT